MNDEKFHFNPSALQGEKKKEKKKKKPFKKKGGNYQKDPIRLFIWAVIVVFIVSGVLAVKNANEAKKSVQEYKGSIEELNQTLEAVTMKQAISTPQTDAFLTRFLTIYFTVPNDREALEQRLEKLQPYNKNLDFRLSTPPKESQQVVTIENYGYQEKDGTLEATYYIKTQHESGLVNESFVTVRFLAIKNGYSIVSLPYQLAYEPETWIQQSKVTDSNQKLSQLDDKQAVTTIKTFVGQFLKEYQENNKENLNYLMKDVQGLPKGWTVESKELAIYGEADSPIVTTTLVLEQAETGVRFNENVQLYLTKTADGKYFIERMTYE